RKARQYVIDDRSAIVAGERRTEDHGIHAGHQQRVGKRPVDPQNRPAVADLQRADRVDGDQIAISTPRYRTLRGRRRRRSSGDGGYAHRIALRYARIISEACRKVRKARSAYASAMLRVTAPDELLGEVDECRPEHEVGFIDNRSVLLQG